MSEEKDKKTRASSREALRQREAELDQLIAKKMAEKKKTIQKKRQALALSAKIEIGRIFLEICRTEKENYISWLINKINEHKIKISKKGKDEIQAINDEINAEIKEKKQQQTQQTQKQTTTETKQNDTRHTHVNEDMRVNDMCVEEEEDNY